MKIKLIGMLLCALILTGCWDTNEAERIFYMLAVGVDYKDGQFEVYGEVVNFLQVAKSEEPKGQAEQSSVGFATGKTIDDAVYKLYKTMDSEVYWGHLSYVVLSEDFLKAEKLDNVIDILTRFYDTRYQVYFYSTQENIRDVLLTVPIIKTSITLSQLARPMNSYEQASFVEPIDMRKLIIGLNEPNHEMIIPYVTIKKNWENINDNTDTVDVSGVGIVSPNDFKGFIKDAKANGLQWMNKHTKRGEVSFLLDEADEKTLTAVILTHLGVKVNPIVESDTIKFDVKISLHAFVSSLTVDVNNTELRKRISEEVEREIRETYKAGLEKDTDIYRLSEHAYRKENKAWKKFEKEGKIELTEDSIRSLDVKVKKVKAGRKSLSKTSD